MRDERDHRPRATIDLAWQSRRTIPDEEGTEIRTARISAKYALRRRTIPDEEGTEMKETPNDEGVHARPVGRHAAVSPRRW